MTFKPSDIADIWENPNFSKMSFEDRGAVLENIIGGAAEYARNAPDYDADVQRTMNKLIDASRAKLGDSESLGEKGKWAAGVAGQTIVDSAKVIGATAADAGFVQDDNQTGEIEGKVPLENVGKGLWTGSQGIWEAAGHGVAAITHREESKAVESQLDTLKAQIDNADYPLKSRDELKRWLSSHDVELNTTRKAWIKAADTQADDAAIENQVKSKSLTKDPEILQNLVAYMRNRTPGTWDAVRRGLIETPTTSRLNQERDSVKETPVGRFLDTINVGSDMLVAAGDPLDNALVGLIPVGKGASMAKKGFKAAMKSAAVGIGTETLSEVGSLLTENPDATMGEIADTAKAGAIGAGGLTAVGAAGGKAMQMWKGENLGEQGGNVAQTSENEGKIPATVEGVAVPDPQEPFTTTYGDFAYYFDGQMWMKPNLPDSLDELDGSPNLPPAMVPMNPADVTDGTLLPQLEAKRKAANRKKQGSSPTAAFEPPVQESVTPVVKESLTTENQNPTDKESLTAQNPANESDIQTPAAESPPVVGSTVQGDSNVSGDTQPPSTVANEQDATPSMDGQQGGGQDMPQSRDVSTLPAQSTPQASKAKSTPRSRDSLPDATGTDSDLISALKRTGTLAVSDGPEFDWYRQLEKAAKTEAPFNRHPERNRREIQARVNRGELDHPAVILEWLKQNRIVSTEGGKKIDEAVSELTGEKANNDGSSTFEVFNVDTANLGDSILATIDARIKARDQGTYEAKMSEEEQLVVAAERELASRFIGHAMGSPGVPMSGNALSNAAVVGSKIDMGGKTFTVAEVDPANGTVDVEGEFGYQRIFPEDEVNVTSIDGQKIEDTEPVEGVDMPFSKAESLSEGEVTKAENAKKLKSVGLPAKAGTTINAGPSIIKALAAIAADVQQNRLYRAIAEALKNQNFDGVDLRIEADGRRSHAGYYLSGNGIREIGINIRHLGRGQVDSVGTFLHEALHHTTLEKIQNPQGAVEMEAVKALTSLVKRVKAYAASQQVGKKYDYELSNVEEFVSAMFTRPDFQTFLAGIPDNFAPSTAAGKFRSVLSEIMRVLAQLVTGKEVATGSVMEQAMTATLALFDTAQRDVNSDSTAASARDVKLPKPGDKINGATVYSIDKTSMKGEAWVVTEDGSAFLYRSDSPTFKLTRGRSNAISSQRPELDVLRRDFQAEAEARPLPVQKNREPSQSGFTYETPEIKGVRAEDLKAGDWIEGNGGQPIQIQSITPRNGGLWLDFGNGNASSAGYTSRFNRVQKPSIQYSPAENYTYLPMPPKAMRLVSERINQASESLSEMLKEHKATRDKRTVDGEEIEPAGYLVRHDADMEAMADSWLDDIAEQQARLGLSMDEIKGYLSEVLNSQGDHPERLSVDRAAVMITRLKDERGMEFGFDPSEVQAIAQKNASIAASALREQQKILDPLDKLVASANTNTGETLAKAFGVDVPKGGNPADVIGTLHNELASDIKSETEQALAEALEAVREELADSNSQASAFSTEAEQLRAELDRLNEELRLAIEKGDINAADKQLADLASQLESVTGELSRTKEDMSLLRKALKLLQEAGRRKNSILKKARKNVNEAFENALKRKRERRASGKLFANPIEEFADDVVIGTALMLKGFIESAAWAKAMIETIGEVSADYLSKVSVESSRGYLDSLEKAEKEVADKEQEKDTEKEAEPEIGDVNIAAITKLREKIRDLQKKLKEVEESLAEEKARADQEMEVGVAIGREEKATANFEAWVNGTAQEGQPSVEDVAKKFITPQGWDGERFRAAVSQIFQDVNPNMVDRLADAVTNELKGNPAPKSKTSKVRRSNGGVKSKEGNVDQAEKSLRLLYEEDGAQRIADNFFRNGAKKKASAPLAEGSSLLNSEITRVLNESLDALGIERKKETKDPNDIFRQVVVGLGLQNLREGKMTEIDKMVRAKIEKMAGGNLESEFATDMIEQWEQVSASILGAPISGTLARKLSNIILAEKNWNISDMASKLDVDVKWMAESVAKAAIAKLKAISPSAGGVSDTDIDNVQSVVRGTVIAMVEKNRENKRTAEALRKSPEETTKRAQAIVDKMAVQFSDTPSLQSKKKTDELRSLVSKAIAAKEEIATLRQDFEALGVTKETANQLVQMVMEARRRSKAVASAIKASRLEEARKKAITKFMDKQAERAAKRGKNVELDNKFATFYKHLQKAATLGILNSQLFADAFSAAWGLNGLTPAIIGQLRQTYQEITAVDANGQPVLRPMVRETLEREFNERINRIAPAQSWMNFIFGQYIAKVLSSISSMVNQFSRLGVQLTPMSAIQRAYQAKQLRPGVVLSEYASDVLAFFQALPTIMNSLRGESLGNLPSNIASGYVPTAQNVQYMKKGERLRVGKGGLASKFVALGPVTWLARMQELWTWRAIKAAEGLTATVDSGGHFRMVLTNHYIAQGMKPKQARAKAIQDIESSPEIRAQMEEIALKDQAAGRIGKGNAIRKLHVEQLIRANIDQRLGIHAVANQQQLTAHAQFKTMPTGFVGFAVSRGMMFLSPSNKGLARFWLMFPRFLGHTVDVTLGYMPIAHLLNKKVSSSRDSRQQKIILEVFGSEEAYQRMTDARAISAAALALSVGSLVMLALGMSEDDDEEPFFSVTGSAPSNDRDIKDALLATGKWGEQQVRVLGVPVLSYGQLPELAPVLGVIGNISDAYRFNKVLHQRKEKDGEKPGKRQTEAGPIAMAIGLDYAMSPIKRSTYRQWAELITGSMSATNTGQTENWLEKLGNIATKPIDGFTRFPLVVDIDKFFKKQEGGSRPDGFAESVLRRLPFAESVFDVGTETFNAYGERTPAWDIISALPSDPKFSDAAKQAAKINVETGTSRGLPQAPGGLLYSDGTRREATAEELSQYYELSGKLYTESLLKNEANVRRAYDKAVSEGGNGPAAADVIVKNISGKARERAKKQLGFNNDDMPERLK